MRRALLYAALALVLLFSTGCGDSVSPAVPFDVVYRVCGELGAASDGVIISDLGVAAAYERASAIIGADVFDSLDGWAVFLPYDGAFRGDISTPDLSTFAHESVDNCACCEFGVILLGDGDGDLICRRLSMRVSDGSGCVVRQGRFVVYSVRGGKEVDAAVRLLECVD